MMLMHGHDVPALREIKKWRALRLMRSTIVRT